MSFIVRMGVPEMKDLWNDLRTRARRGILDKSETRLLKRFSKAVLLLAANPRHNSLQSHDIDPLTQRYSKVVRKPCKVWQSYLENKTPAAGRLYWVYGPGKSEITIIGLEPHPEDRKKAGYANVSLSDLPPLLK